ncbi:MAG: hypothetical protein JO027_18075 [Solirubrobacterales bacterium]|nr:hypothetical protein [Solirubrobacterales bacterium]
MGKLAGAVLIAALTGASPAAAALTPPQMHTVAGGGSCSAAAPAALSGGSCDGVAATSVAIGEPGDVAALPGGGFLYVDSAGPTPGYEFVREVSKSGKVFTVAGDGTDTDAPDGTLAVESGLDGPVAVAPLADGGFLITEKYGSVIRMVSPGTPATATITTIAGTGTPGFNGDGPATSAKLNAPTDAQPLADGRVLIADAGNGLIRVLSAAAPGATIATIGGGGSCDDVTGPCDGMAADAVKLSDPVSVSPIQGGAGGYLIAEDAAHGANAIREVSQPSAAGTFATVAGVPGAGPGYGGDGGPAVFAQLDNPQRVMSTPGGGFLIADKDNNRVRAVSPAGIITTIAGDGTPTYAGDGGPATGASLFGPVGVSPTSDGGLLIADASDPAIREVTNPPTTIITTTPSSPNGTNQWFIGTVQAKVSAGSGTSTSCDLDLTTAPTVYDELDSPCAFSGSGATISGNGVHVLWAASINSFGDKETPVSFTIGIDSTPPAMRCERPLKFAAGSQHERVRATVSDAVSGPRRPVVSAAADTRNIGRHTVTLVGANNAGISTLVHCQYAVVAAALRPTPAMGWAFTPVGAATDVRRLLVRDVPARASVEVSCAGTGCPFSSLTKDSRRRHGRYSIDLAAAFSGARLAAGAQLTVRVSERNTVSRVWMFTIRGGHPPAQRVGCVSPGSTGPPQRC